MARSKRKWTTKNADGKSDEDLLKELFEEGLTDEQIGQQLGRSAGSVSDRRRMKHLRLLRGYTMSGKAYAQRVKAAVKHSDHAQHPLNRSGQPCKPDRCPIPGPDGKGCDIKRRADQEDQPVGACPVLGGNTDYTTAFLKAIEHGDFSDLNQHNASGLSSMRRVFDLGVRELLEDGVTYEEESHSEYGGSSKRKKDHPGWRPTLAYARASGLHANDVLATLVARGRSDHQEDGGTDPFEMMAKDFEDTETSQRFGKPLRSSDAVDEEDAL